MAARESPRRQREATKQPMFDQRAPRIFRARRREPTRRGQQRRDQPLIGGDDAGREPAERAHDRLGPGMAASAWRI